MKFSTKEDVEASIEAVFDMLCDFEGFERSAMRRGAEVQRKDELTAPGVGMTWQAAFLMRGKKREIELELVTFSKPTELVFESTSSGLIGSMSVELMSLSRSRTRMLIELEMKPLNLSARLLIQSLKLAKGSLTRKFKDRVGNYAKTLEERHNQSNRSA